MIDPEIPKKILKKCQICLKNRTVQGATIMNFRASKVLVREVFAIITGIKLTTEPSLCGSCRSQLQNAYKLRMRAQKSQKILTRTKPEILEAPKLKEIKKEENQLATCDICGQEFVDLSTIRVHMRLKHIDSQRPCEICGKNFDAKNLGPHLKTHDRSRPFKCKIPRMYGSIQIQDSHDASRKD